MFCTGIHHTSPFNHRCFGFDSHRYLYLTQFEGARMAGCAPQVFLFLGWGVVPGEVCGWLLGCFQHCFGGSSLIPSSPDDGRNLEDDSPAQDYQWGSASEKASRGHDSTSNFKETVHTMVRDDESGKNISAIEMSSVIPYSPSTCQELRSRKFKQSSLLISVGDIYLEGLNDLNALEDDCSDMRRENVMKMENDECVPKSSEIRSIVYGENNITAGRKGEPSPAGRSCSRINGRGWQCKKMPLPGYALCEYHLDLARTRVLEKKLN